MDKKSLSGRDICTQFITPAVALAGWGIQRQMRREVSFTEGRIIARGRQHSRSKSRRAGFFPHDQPHVPLAVSEAMDNSHAVGDCMQYTEALVQ